MDNLWDGLRWALGLGVAPEAFNTLQVTLRAVVIYLGGLLIGVRLQEPRVVTAVTLGAFA